jgi:hypothetical protein
MLGSEARMHALCALGRAARRARALDRAGWATPAAARLGGAARAARAAARSLTA